MEKLKVLTMKMLRKSLGLLLTPILLIASAWGQTTPAPAQNNAAAPSTPLNVHTADDPGILHETQITVDVNGRTGLVWWIPFEFWVNAAEKNGTPADKARQSFSALQDYIVVGVLLAKVSDLGTFDYVSPADLQKKTFVRDAGGQEYATVGEVGGDAKNLADIMKPMLANAMGRAGENFAMIFFPAKSKSGKRIADATSKGQFSIVLKDIAGEPETIYHWRTPLSSLSAPRYCPVGKERVHADWDYCPWHGVKLEDKQ
jgi:hypothetical protein